MTIPRLIVKYDQCGRCSRFDIVYYIPPRYSVHVLSNIYVQVLHESL